MPTTCGIKLAILGLTPFLHKGHLSSPSRVRKGIIPLLSFFMTWRLLLSLVSLSESISLESTCNVWNTNRNEQNNKYIFLPPFRVTFDAIIQVQQFITAV